MSDSLSMSVLVVVGTRVVVRGLAGEEVVGGHEHRVRHGDDSLLMAAMPHHAPIPSREGALRRSGAGGERGLDECAAQPPVALAGLPGFVLPRTLVVARTQAGPTGEMRRRREHAHIHPDLEVIAPFAEEVSRLDTIPGVNRRTAEFWSVNCWPTSTKIGRASCR